MKKRKLTNKRLDIAKTSSEMTLSSAFSFSVVTKRVKRQTKKPFRRPWLIGLAIKSHLVTVFLVLALYDDVFVNITKPSRGQKYLKKNKLAGLKAREQMSIFLLFLMSVFLSILHVHLIFNRQYLYIVKFRCVCLGQ